MASKVEICGVNTAKLPLYKEAEMMEMIEKVKAGDKETRDKFIQGNLRLVLSVIQRFSNRGENPDDLFQVGCIGLIKALDNFDISLIASSIELEAVFKTTTLLSLSFSII